jgi:hypothetical protein
MQAAGRLSLLDLVGPSADQQDFERNQDLQELGIYTHGIDNGRRARLSVARLRAAVGARLLRQGEFIPPRGA